MRSLLLILAFGSIQAEKNIDITLESGGVKRFAWLHLPPVTHWKGKIPLVMDFHAMGCNPFEESMLTDFSSLADKEGFAVVYPKGYDNADTFAIPGVGPLPLGTPDGMTWNAGACCPGANTKKRDDVQFVRDLLAKLLTEYQLDDTRVYATGMSNGAFFTNRLACEAREMFAAIAPVSGNLANNSSPIWSGGQAYSCPEFKPPLPVLYFNGDHDPFLIWKGNPVFGFPSIPDYINRLLALNGVDSSYGQGNVSYQNGNVECWSHGPSASNVTLCKVGGGGHFWPGSHKLCRLAHFAPVAWCSMHIDATAQIWDFFKRYSLQRNIISV